ncbi:MAC/perforin domain-containing protein [Parabacteroides faecis]|uniref:MACPF domain-containing protein n=1 Tax=Parabacteroides faecis TaxID=1217282 RepID=A0ABR6KSA8_9BACT|nr:MAC/perforin domain-containing protein [Parabacteroides faecis]MBB4624311.1 hypothetical protein [Parabacteroides faecis]
MKRTVIFFILSALIFSCTMEDEADNDLSLKSESVNACKTVVLKERDPKFPLEFPLRNKTKNSTTSFAMSSNEDFLGCTYKLQYFPLGTAQNVGVPIVNIKKLKEEYEDFYVKERNIGIQKSDVFSYASFERYSHKSKDSEKVTHGVNLNFKLFSIGNKGTIENIYGKDVANETNRVYGEFNAEVLGKRYILETSTNALNMIKLGYLNPSFRSELYSITMAEFVREYGTLVLRDFYTGGRVSAIYSGIYTSNDLVETKEKNIDNDINASYGPKKDVSGSGNLGIGLHYYDETKMSKKITNMTLSVKAVGGNLSFSSFSSPQGLTQVNIDLSSWMSSMASPDSYRMIDIESEGLMPISNFVLEKNIVQHINDYLYGQSIGQPMEVQEPYIEVLRRNIQGITMLITSLVTKNDDRVLIDLKNITPVSESKKQEYIRQIANEKSKVYGLKIINTTISNDTLPIPPKNCFQLGFYKEELFSKFIDKENNTIYLLYNGTKTKESNELIIKRDFIKEMFSNARQSSDIDENGVSISLPKAVKCGLSIYNYDRTLNLYGLKDFVNKLPTINIDKGDLLNYELISL